MVSEFDVEAIIKLTTEKTFNIKQLLITVYTNSELIYDYLVLLRFTWENGSWSS